MCKASANPQRRKKSGRRVTSSHRGVMLARKNREEDAEPFAEKMARLTAELKAQMEEGARLDREILRNLGGLEV